MPAPAVMEMTVSERGRLEAHHQHQVGGDAAASGQLRLTASAPRLLRVLVVDDDQDATDSLARLVRDWGHEVRWAYDAGVGLQVAAAEPPDLVLLDIAMPQIDGCDLARQLRGDARLKECFLIAVSGCGDEAHRRRCLQAGIDLVLVKPVDPLILESLLVLEREYVRDAHLVRRVSRTKASLPPRTGVS
jgi:DNA-binding response OmpR family regulator